MVMHERGSGFPCASQDRAARSIDRAFSALQTLLSVTRDRDRLITRSLVFSPPQSMSQISFALSGCRDSVLAAYFISPTSLNPFIQFRRCASNLFSLSLSLLAEIVIVDIALYFIYFFYIYVYTGQCTVYIQCNKVINSLSVSQSRPEL